MQDYITIDSYKFRVLKSNATPIVSKNRKYSVTLSGKLDYQIAPLVRSWSYDLLIERGNADYASIGELRTLYEASDPDSNYFTLVDQDSHTREVVFVGDLRERNLAPYIEHDDCTYIVATIQLRSTT